MALDHLHTRTAEPIEIAKLQTLVTFRWLRRRPISWPQANRGESMLTGGLLFCGGFILRDTLSLAVGYY